MTVSCPRCRERKDIRLERHISDGGEAISCFLARLACATCRGMPDTIRLHREKPKVEVFPDGVGSLLMAINVTRDMVTSTRRAEYDYYQRGRAGGSDRFIPTPDPVIRAMLEAALKVPVREQARVERAAALVHEEDLGRA